MGLTAALRRLAPRFFGPAAAWSPDSISAAVAGFGVISGFGALDEELQQAIQPGERSSAPTIGWRRAVLVAVALTGCLLVFLLARQLALAPSLAVDWRAGAPVHSQAGGQRELAREQEDEQAARQGHGDEHGTPPADGGGAAAFARLDGLLQLFVERAEA